MSIENPSEPSNLPEAIKKEIDIAKNQIAINEQELVTIQKSRLAEGYAVRELLKHKEQLEGEIKFLEADIESAKKTSIEVNTENVKIKRESKELEALNTEISSDLTLRKRAVEEAEAFAADQKEKIKEQIAELGRFNEELILKNEKLNLFVSKMSKVISEF